MQCTRYLDWNPGPIRFEQKSDRAAYEMIVGFKWTE